MTLLSGILGLSLGLSLIYLLAYLTRARPRTIGDWLLDKTEFEAYWWQANCNATIPSDRAFLDELNYRYGSTGLETLLSEFALQRLQRLYYA